MGHLVGIETGDILDQRGFDGGGIVARLDDRARDRIDLASAGALFVGDGKRGMKAAPAGDDLEAVIVAAARPHQKRHQHAARTDGGKDVGDVGSLPAVPHVRSGYGKLAKVDMGEFHGCCSLSGGPARPMC